MIVPLRLLLDYSFSIGVFARCMQFVLTFKFAGPAAESSPFVRLGVGVSAGVNRVVDFTHL